MSISEAELRAHLDRGLGPAPLLKKHLATLEARGLELGLVNTRMAHLKCSFRVTRVAA
jgi:hypothetical protein